MKRLTVERLILPYCGGNYSVPCKAKWAAGNSHWDRASRWEFPSGLLVHNVHTVHTTRL